MIISRTQIRIKNVLKTKVPKTTSPKKQVEKMKPKVPKTTSPKKTKVSKTTSPKKQVEKMKPKVPKTTSPKKQVGTLLENNIVIPQQDFTSLKTNETFDEFILFKQEYMSHPNNQKKFLSQKMMMCY